MIQLLADQGHGGLTHRRVASVAGLSVGATTHHYLTKGDMIADASCRLLEDYLRAFKGAAIHYRDGVSSYRSLDELIARIVSTVLERDRHVSLAWYEILLEAAHRPEGRDMARTWYGQLSLAWGELLEAMGLPKDDIAARVGIDTLVGKFFIAHSLGLSVEQIRMVDEGADPRIAWKQEALSGAEPSRLPARRTPKAQATRARIVRGAIDLLIREGAGAVTYRTVAEATGLAIAAPGYYFGSIEELLREAETELFQEAMERYRQMFTASRLTTLSADSLADLNTAIFIREATEFSGSAVAYYSVCLEAARRPELRAPVSAALFSQAGAWKYAIDTFASAGMSDGARLQALFIGQLMRAITCGSPVGQLAEARQKFRHAIGKAIG